MNITVLECDWGGSSRSNIEALLTDAARHLTGALRKAPTGNIAVAATPTTDDPPIALFRSSPEEPYRIFLQARGRHWSQFAYQFSHELCHVLSDYERLRGSRNRWFHEAICELASVFTLRRMAEAWPTQPPYPNWAGYAQSLASYAEVYLVKDERRVPAGTTLAGWVSSEEESLRRDCLQRDKNAVVAYSLLPIFESNPTLWNAVLRLPNSSAKFRDYLIEWHASVGSAEKPLVERMLGIFGLKRGRGEPGLKPRESK